MGAVRNTFALASKCFHVALRVVVVVSKISALGYGDDEPPDEVEEVDAVGGGVGCLGLKRVLSEPEKECLCGNMPG